MFPVPEMFAIFAIFAIFEPFIQMLSTVIRRNVSFRGTCTRNLVDCRGGAPITDSSLRARNDTFTEFGY